MTEEKCRQVKVFATLDDGRRIALIFPEAVRDEILERLALNVDFVIPENQLVTFRKVVTAAQAMTLAKDVSEEIQREREPRCNSCEFLRKDPKSGNTFCQLCGCTVKKNSMINMIRKEENLPAWGCKHPQRGKVDGKGWVR